jgi:hypothetical protein
VVGFLIFSSVKTHPMRHVLVSYMGVKTEKVQHGSILLDNLKIYCEDQRFCKIIVYADLNKIDFYKRNGFINANLNEKIDGTFIIMKEFTKFKAMSFTCEGN